MHVRGLSLSKSALCLIGYVTFGGFRAASKSRHLCCMSFQSDISLPLGGGIRQLQKEHERRWEKAPGLLFPVEEQVPWPEAWL